MLDTDIALKKLPLVAVIRGLDIGRIKDVGTTLIEAGFTLIEVTLNSPEPLKAIEILVEISGQSASIGAGTVLSVQDVKDVKTAGGQFIISPNMDEDVIRETKNCGLVSWPGVFTPTEAFNALKYGADGLKAFPAESISPQTLKAWRAVLPLNTQIFIVGGVDAASMKPYLAAGAGGFGLGSSLVSANKSLEDIRRDAVEIVTAYHDAVESLSNG
ncbi:MAG: 2-dehydro-3-deoxy-6-phosphogalactonate aldolase [Robiginitomaculum sp.]|nr:2-dehydro-3-deoxy-6-phosphogalactonate aldolase [Robiginitomaculum sp.]